MMITVSKEILFELEKKLLQQEIRIAELEVQTTWQPIETIPDKSRILVTGSWGVTVAYKNGNSICDTIGELQNVTHWMPLPKPPEEK